MGGLATLRNKIVAASRESSGVAWWPSGSLWSADFENEQFRAPSGVIYADEAAFNTALGIGKSGEARTWQTDIYGSEELPDGGFSSGVDSWEASPAYVANVVTARVGNELQMQWIANGQGRIRRPCTVDADQGYVFSLDMTSFASLGSAGPRVGMNTDLGSSVGPTNGDFVLAGLPQTKTIAFAPPGTTAYLGVATGSGTVSVSTANFDNASMKKARPYAGFVRDRSALINFTTPATLAAVKVIAQWGDGSERNRVRVLIDASAVLRVIVTRDAAETVNLNLGTLSPNTRYSLKFAVANNRCSASLNGNPIVTDTSVIVPGATNFWLGRSFTGETFDGTIHSIDVWAEALSDAALIDPFRAIVVWGDSLATSTGASSTAAAWWSQLAARYGWSVISRGVGSNSAADVEARFDADPDAAILRQCLSLFINRPNGGETFAQFMPPHERMASKVSRAFFVPPVVNSPSGQPDANAAVISAVQTELLTANWTGRTLDASAQAAFLTAMNDDSTRIGGGDWTHFDDSGHDEVESAVHAGLVAAGLVA